MAGGFGQSSLARGFNRVTTALMDVPLVGGFVRRGLVTIRYVGRRSGKTIELPVGYRRTGDSISIAVTMPDSKTWWRNFLGEGAPITLVELDGRDRLGHAIASRDQSGRVLVEVRLDEPTG